MGYLMALYQLHKSFSVKWYESLSHSVNLK